MFTQCCHRLAYAAIPPTSAEWGPMFFGLSLPHKAASVKKKTGQQICKNRGIRTWSESVNIL